MNERKNYNFFETFFGLGGQQSVDFWTGLPNATTETVSEYVGGTIGKTTDKAMSGKTFLFIALIIGGIYIWKTK